MGKCSVSWRRSCSSPNVKTSPRLSRWCAPLDWLRSGGAGPLHHIRTTSDEGGSAPTRPVGSIVSARQSERAAAWPAAGLTMERTWTTTISGTSRITFSAQAQRRRCSDCSGLAFPGGGDSSWRTASSGYPCRTRWRRHDRVHLGRHADVGAEPECNARPPQSAVQVGRSYASPKGLEALAQVGRPRVVTRHEGVNTGCRARSGGLRQA